MLLLRTGDRKEVEDVDPHFKVFTFVGISEMVNPKAFCPRNKKMHKHKNVLTIAEVNESFEACPLTLD